jgi:16S rRNA (uracil1498-N3)-methyltransferase
MGAHYTAGSAEHRCTACACLVSGGKPCSLCSSKRHYRTSFIARIHVSAPRFYVDQPLPPAGSFVLPEEAARHVRVLRLREGDDVLLFDGQGGEVPARLMDLGGKRMTVLLADRVAVERESPLDIWLLQALPAADKMDWIIQKAVELGATGILPWQAERSVLKLDAERAAKRLVHWQGVAIAACEQCGRNRLPVIEPAAKLADVLAQASGRRLLALSPISDAAPVALEAEPAALVIGPEGGFSPAELVVLGQAGATSLTLGPRILRTETAGLAALSALNAKLGDFAFPVA